MKDELISQISAQLNICCSANPITLCNLIYSASGRIALASLWDHPEDDRFVSIQHFKKRISQVLDASASVCPSCRNFFPEEKSVLIQEIYEIYRRNGLLYHTPHRISPAEPKSCQFGNCVLYRGALPEQKCFMSGLGLYGVRQNPSSSASVQEVFDLPRNTLSGYLKEVLRKGEWTKITWPEDTEFLRMDPPFKNSYWWTTPDNTGRIAMARYGSPLPIYVLYRFENRRFQHRQISEWRVTDFRASVKTDYGEYRRISNALLDFYGQLPPIRAHFNGKLMEVHPGYRLPPEEEDFFRLYSWPMDYDITASTPKVFCRAMSPIVYPAFKQALEAIGYHFVEE